MSRKYTGELDDVLERGATRFEYVPQITDALARLRCNVGQANDGAFNIAGQDTGGPDKFAVFNRHRMHKRPRFGAKFVETTGLEQWVSEGPIRPHALPELQSQPRRCRRGWTPRASCVNLTHQEEDSLHYHSLMY